jgi:hypothetical protein
MANLYDRGRSKSTQLVTNTENISVSSIPLVGRIFRTHYAGGMLMVILMEDLDGKENRGSKTDPWKTSTSLTS